MKKKFLTVLAMALMITGASYAQGFHLGVKGGANLAKIDNQSFKDGFKFGYNFGGFAEINFSKKWGIQPEVLWSQNNYKTAANIGEVVPGGMSDVNVKLDYLQVPLLLSYRPSKLITFQAGPQFGILINQNKTFLQNGQEAFKKGDFALLGGAQLNLGPIKAGARYVVGLNDVADITTESQWKSKGWQLYVGLRIL